MSQLRRKTENIWVDDENLLLVHRSFCVRGACYCKLCGIDAWLLDRSNNFSLGAATDAIARSPNFPHCDDFLIVSAELDTPADRRRVIVKRGNRPRGAAGCSDRVKLISENKPEHHVGVFDEYRMLVMLSRDCIRDRSL